MEVEHPGPHSELSFINYLTICGITSTRASSTVLRIFKLAFERMISIMFHGRGRPSPIHRLYIIVALEILTVENGEVFEIKKKNFNGQPHLPFLAVLKEN